MYHKTANMLAKLSVLLGFLIAVSLGQAPDCKVVPRTRVMCCPNVLEDDSVEEVIKQCVDENKAVAKSPILECTMDTCILKKKNLIGSDNKIDKAAYIKYFKQYLKEFSPSIETSVEKCVAETETSECIPTQFYMCLYSELMRNCPSNLWLKTEECTILKKFSVDCPNASIYNIITK